MKYLRTALRETQITERRWANSWGLGWAGLTALQLAVSPLVPKDDHKRDDLYVGAAGSVVGLVPTLLVRPRSLAYEDLATGTEESCDTLSSLEDALESTATDERLRNGWISRIGGTLFSTGLGLFLGLHYHHWVSGGFSIGFGLVSTEAMIRTGTNHAVEALARYRAGTLAPQRGTNADDGDRSLRVSLILEPDSAGLGFSLAI